MTGIIVFFALLMAAAAAESVAAVVQIVRDGHRRVPTVARR